MSSAEVDAFVHGLDEEWKRRDCAAMVHIIRTLDVPLTESIKWGNPFFAGNKAVTKWFVAREWINVYFYQGQRLADPRGLLEASDTARMRTMRLTGAAPWTVPGRKRSFASSTRVAPPVNGSPRGCRCVVNAGLRSSDRLQACRQRRGPARPAAPASGRRSGRPAARPRLAGSGAAPRAIPAPSGAA